MNVHAGPGFSQHRAVCLSNLASGKAHSYSPMHMCSRSAQLRQTRLVFWNLKNMISITLVACLLLCKPLMKDITANTTV